MHDYGQKVVLGFKARSHFSLFNNLISVIIQNCSICPQMACLGSHSFATCLCVESAKIDQNTIKQYYQINIRTRVRKNVKSHEVVPKASRLKMKEKRNKRLNLIHFKTLQNKCAWNSASES